MKSDKEYIRELEKTLAKFLEPVKGIPFSIAIKALTGFKVLTFDSEKNKKLLDLLKEAVELAGRNAYLNGIFTKRPNEAGNKIEPFILDALNEVGIKSGRPISKSGRKKSAGYPDIESRYQGKTIYIECKTYNTKTKNQTFRTFYFSPMKDPKITKDAYHLLISFELDEEIRDGKRVFVPISWQIYTLDKLKVQVKHEFNASNKDIYCREALLAEGKISKIR